MKTLIHSGLAVLVVALICSCGNHSAGQNTEDAPSFDYLESVVNDPSDYFPVSVGTKWTYNITVGETQPMSYYEAAWPIGDRHISYAMTGYYPEAVKGTYRLVVRVKSKTDRQGPLEYRLGVELEVLEDELGVFRDAKQMFYAISTARLYMANLVVTYDARDGPPIGSWRGGSSHEGYSVRLIFFGAKPGTLIGVGQNPSDLLLFKQLDTGVGARHGAPAMHFVRTVAKNSDDDANVGDSNELFTEHMWYAKGKGLVLLKQSINGRTSMTWSLVSVTKN